MAAVARTLDLREPQILRHFPHDQNGFYWHHRILLHKISPGIFIALTPDADLERINLFEVDHLPLERRADFPGPQAPYVYAFDEVPRAELERHKRRAQQMASLFNETPVDDIDAYEWIVALPSHARFGESVDEQLLDDGVTLGDSGLVMLDGNETFVRRIATSQKAEFLTEADASRGDLRLLGTFKDGQGKRFLDFKSAMSKLTEDSMNDWNLQGPRVVLEFLKAVRSGPGDLATYHLSWAKSSGVNIFSMPCHDHRIICNVLRAALETDQLNISNLLAFETLTRRLVQIETAVGRSPLSPDFTGLELVLEDPIGSGGEAVTSSFNNWLASKLKDQAFIAKQTRLYKEEFRGGKGAGMSSDHSNAAAGSDDAHGRGRGKGKGPKPKPKPGAHNAGAGGSV